MSGHGIDPGPFSVRSMALSWFSTSGWQYITLPSNSTSRLGLVSMTVRYFRHGFQGLLNSLSRQPRLTCTSTVVVMWGLVTIGIPVSACVWVKVRESNLYPVGFAASCSSEWFKIPSDL